MPLYRPDHVLRLVRRFPRGGPFAWLEILLLIGLALAMARLVWTIVTPVSPLGDWRPRRALLLPAGARTALFARFDPFYRAVADEGAQPVTSLSLKLFGLRVNEATGLGSAIIETPDGVQSSYAVGDEIAPGVTLKAVAIDHVVLDKGGADELLYIDQSEPAPVATPGPRVPPASVPVTAPATMPRPGVPVAPSGNMANFAPAAQQRPQPAANGAPAGSNTASPTQ